MGSRYRPLTTVNPGERRFLELRERETRLREDLAALVNDGSEEVEKRRRQLQTKIDELDDEIAAIHRHTSRRRDRRRSSKRPFYSQAN